MGIRWIGALSCTIPPFIGRKTQKPEVATLYPW
jgi:hypothetical protein